MKHLPVKCTNCETKFHVTLLDGDLLTDIACTNCDQKTLEKDE